MRACFTASPGRVLVSADYSQVELRVLAHCSQDPTLLAAFRGGEDIHTRTAALLNDVEPAAVTPDQRRGAKTINFGLIYGMGARKLAQELGISLAEAKAFMERYFARFSHIKEFYDEVETRAREQGYVTTLARAAATFARYAVAERPISRSGRTAGGQHPDPGQRGRYHQVGHAGRARRRGTAQPVGQADRSRCMTNWCWRLPRPMPRPRAVGSPNL